eukprot:5777920-Heterocapsa_arctica.AAC.1
MDKSQSAMPMGNVTDDWTQFEPSARTRLATIPEQDEGGGLGDQDHRFPGPLDHESNQDGTLTPMPDGGATPVP